MAAPLRHVGVMDSVLNEFLVESGENLDQFERDLVAVERNPDAHDMLANAFRAIHSIKGSTGFLGLSKLGALAHAGESLLSDLREGRVVFTPSIGSDLLQLVDFIRQMLSDIERTGADTDTDCVALVERLDARLHHPPATVVALPVVVAGPSRPVLAQPLVLSVPRGQSMRVDVGQLDSLMNLVGELVLTRNEVLQHSALQEDPVLRGAFQRLNAITTQLQAGVMVTRMQPIDNVWSAFPRIVRDLALECRKQVRLDLNGQDTELDKTLLEAIKDPLTHLVRNCIDHGIEAPDLRLALGKPAEGCVSLRAFHEGGQVHIEVSDDGAGMDVAELRRTAVERGLITTEQADAAGDQEAMRLVFLPGFSTARTITSVSGRGVGMDVVKTNIEQIGGSVSLDSLRGVGTTLKIRIPLTLAIIPALIVISDGDRVAIPQVGVREVLRLDAGGVQMMGDAAVIRLRGALVPLIRLDSALGMRTRPAADDIASSGALDVVILQADDRLFGLVVDDVIDTQEIVVKPLDRRLRALSVFAGATIMGDGRVALILDVTAFAVHAHVLSGLRPSGGAIAPSLETPDEVTQTLLAVVGDDDARMAVPLSQVIRLEEFPASSIERAGNRNVVQCRGEILPLIDLSDLVSGREPHRRNGVAGPGDTVKAIVSSSGGVRVGLIVTRILDTVEHPIAAQVPGNRRGVCGSALIEGRVTEILDLEALCVRVASHAAALPFLESVAV
jgi:two-component system, chemotaxis family, sensor kinase CheA